VYDRECKLYLLLLSPLFQCWLVSKLARWNRVSNKRSAFFSWLDAERLEKRYHAERGNEVAEE
jgi:hypothetical protein